jgi:hypothetical protein
MYRSLVGVYVPSKPSSWSPTGAWLTPTASLVGSGEKLGTDPWVGQPTCCGLCRQPFFLRRSGIRPNLSTSHEGLLYVNHIKYVWSWTIRRLSVESVWHIGQVFPCMMHIDLNRRDSRI